MPKLPLLILFLAILTTTLHGQPVRWVASGNAAVTLTRTALYADSTYTRQTRIFLGEGSILKITGRSTLPAENAAQNQLYYWYEVETEEGFRGWLHGAVIALVAKQKNLMPQEQAFHKKTLRFGGKSGTLFAWVAILEGRENGPHAFLAPPYFEKYLVLTDATGKSNIILLSSEGIKRTVELKQLRLDDITGDGNYEIILWKSSKPFAQKHLHPYLEIFGFTNSGFKKLFEEDGHLPLINGEISPAAYKIIEILPFSIRIEYVDFHRCENQIIRDAVQKSKISHCIDFVTYTYYWQPDEQTFGLLYPVSRSVLKAKTATGGLFLKSRAAYYSDRLEILPRHLPLVVLKQVQTSGDKFKYWLYVQLPNGKKGYLPAHKLKFIECMHAPVLEYFYKNNQIYPAFDFLRIPAAAAPRN